MVLEIKFYGDHILRKKGKPVKTFGEPLRQFSRDMLAVMHEAEGIGLAAQQVGEALQFCIVEVTQELEKVPIKCIFDGKTIPQDLLLPLFLANPVITSFEKPREFCEEGCLSFPGIRGEVERPVGISISFQDLEGNPHTLACDGLLARCIQHEMDHLNGILFIDRMQKSAMLEIDDEVRDLKKRTIQQIKD
tara:strand:+ start:136 stop:708 length:573 start_codon:yes stop_codon:yes gene_type:complete